MSKTTDYAIGEWWTGHRRIEGDELEGVYRRMKRRGDIVTDERGSVKGGPVLTVLRPDRPAVTCGDCGRAYDASGSAWMSATTRCPQCRSRRASAGKRGQTA